MLAHKLTKKHNVVGWWMSEKLDGVRAIWTGSTFLSRAGNVFNAPEWFTRHLPKDVVLDGELFVGRGQFQAAISVVKKKVPIDHEWMTIKYHVFDVPQVDGGFEERIDAAYALNLPAHIATVVPHIECRDIDHMEEFFDQLVSEGAEGLMLRAPKSKYVNARSKELLKHKPFDSDEATVVGHEEGKGRLEGLTGKLVVQWKGKEFRVGAGLNDADRANPPIVGSLITFGHCGLTDDGIPRFPTFTAVRNYE
jgi:DNA ligase-1